MNFLLFSNNYLRFSSSKWSNRLLNKNTININLKKIVPVIHNSTQIQINNKSVDKNNSNWHTIYRLPIIKWAASFNKLKFYQIGLLTLGTPLSFALETASHIPVQSTTIFLCAGITGLITLSLGSLVTQNLIGFIYLNSDGNHIQISCIDFWGKRKDTTHSIDDILNVSSSKLNLFQIVQTNDKTSPTYKLVYRFSEISDQHNFNSIFGE